jgi:putative membrane protein insertion efficiency factor
MNKQESKNPRWVIEVASLPIHFYKYVISPLTPAACRHYPTCSEYGLKALSQHGLINGGILTLDRLARCQPWGTAGFDPVPDFTFKIFMSSRHKCLRLKEK